MQNCSQCKAGETVREPAERKRILVIDDDEQALISLERLLENEGYETTTAWSGEEGLALLRSNVFDLVLLDDYLRDIEHEDIFGEIRAMAPHPLVILTESFLMPEEKRYFINLGATAIVRKWAPGKEIVEVIRGCFSKPSLESVAA
jgi:DNA-binding response OmpR family regulator